MLMAVAHTVDEIVKLTALALCFSYYALPGIQLYDIQLKPFTARSEMNGQAFLVCDETEMFRQLDHGLAVHEFASATNVGACFASLQRYVNDLFSRIGGMVLHKVFLTTHREVAFDTDATC